MHFQHLKDDCGDDHHERKSRSDCEDQRVHDLFSLFLRACCHLFLEFQQLGNVFLREVDTVADLDFGLHGIFVNARDCAVVIDLDDNSFRDKFRFIGSQIARNGDREALSEREISRLIAFLEVFDNRHLFTEA